VKEYFDQGAEIYDITERKQHVLIPAISRQIPQAKKGQKLLDLACGNGTFYKLFTSKGYEYTGVDVSPDMVDLAKRKYPNGKYLVADATTFTSSLKEKFEMVTAILLLPSLVNLKKVKQAVQECQKALEPGGSVVFAVPHSCFDMYMRKGILGKEDVETEWTGYFNTAAKFTFKKQFPKGEFEFEDYHYTFEDYIAAIHEAGLRLIGFDECKPEESLAKTNPNLYQKYFEIPGYVVLIATNPKG